MRKATKILVKIAAWSGIAAIVFYLLFILGYGLFPQQDTKETHFAGYFILVAYFSVAIFQLSAVSALICFVIGKLVHRKG